MRLRQRKLRGQSVKIGSLTGTIAYMPKVREKSEGDSSSNSESFRQKNPHSEDSENTPDQESEASPEKIDQAILNFMEDLQAQAPDIRASVEGSGPGLRVVLKDGGGGLVRQFTGEEFLKIRQGTAKDGKIRGKILDQKL